MLSQEVQFEASRAMCIMDTNKNVTLHTGADEIKQKNLLTKLLRLAKQHSKGVARNVENLIQGFIDGK